MREEELGIALFGQLFQFPHRCHARHRVEVEARDDFALKAPPGINGVPCEQHRPATLELDQKADVPGRMPRRFDNCDAPGDLRLTRDQLVLGPISSKLRSE